MAPVQPSALCRGHFLRERHASLWLPNLVVQLARLHTLVLPGLSGPRCPLLNSLCRRNARAETAGRQYYDARTPAEPHARVAPPYQPARRWIILGAMSSRSPEPIRRSAELMSARDTALVVIDVQEKLAATVAESARVVWNCRRLVDGAGILGLPVVATEQYPEGLGPTVAELADLVEHRHAKLRFSCYECEGAFRALSGRGIARLLLCGLEAHVCVVQTAMDLLAEGWMVYVAADAVGSRFEHDCEIALRRMDSAGAVLTTTEAALFEWCETADRPEFAAISRLVRETAPG